MHPGVRHSDFSSRAHLGWYSNHTTDESSFQTHVHL
jgi:hypothetical protein